MSGLSEPELRGVEEAVEGADAKLSAKTRLSAAVASRGSLYMLCRHTIPARSSLYTIQVPLEKVRQRPVRRIPNQPRILRQHSARHIRRRWLPVPQSLLDLLF